MTSFGIMRRDFRHDPGLPETEVTRHKGTKRKKRKHIQEYKRVVLGTVTTRTWWSKEPREVVKEQHICSGCGHRRTYTGGSRWGW